MFIYRTNINVSFLIFLLLRPLKMYNFVFECVLVIFRFFFVFHVKSSATNDHQKGSSDTPKFPQSFFVSRKTGLKF